jgi:hypothetical protein
VIGWLSRLGERYAPDDERPLGGYLASLTAYASLVGGLATAIRRQGPPAARLPAADLGLVTVATFRASRLLADANVTSVLRAPFTRYAGAAGAGEVAEEVRRPDGGHRHAIGELVGCPYCLGMWLATLGTAGLVLAPRWTRLAASALAVEAGADVLQKLYSDLQAR